MVLNVKPAPLKMQQVLPGHAVACLTLEKVAAFDTKTPLTTRVGELHKVLSMKNNIVKMTAAAALVLGMASAAHAASQAKIEFDGRIVETACDVMLDNSNDSSISLGAFAKDQFTDNVKVFSEHAAPIKLDLGTQSCKGANVPAGQSITLTATQQGSIPVSVETAGLFGDADIGVGVDLLAAPSNGATLPTSGDYKAITPKTGLELFANGTSSAVVPGTITLPSYVFLKAGLRAYDYLNVVSGPVHSSITFTAAYD